jgi:glycosyltransferase involved in cell wall biosynthesis
MIELADCFVSLHRAEGFGLNLAAAMAAGRPVIATGYSGNTTFMDAGTAFLVPYDLVPVGPDCHPYPPDASWAEPDLDAAARLMRLVFDGGPAVARVAARGRSRILQQYSVAACGRFFRDRLLADWPGWEDRPPPTVEAVA